MHPTLFMGHLEWLELGLFALLAVTVAVLLMQCRQRPHAQPERRETPRLAMQHRDWRLVPEIQLVVLALPLELVWEIAQFPLYTVWHEGTWSYILYGLAHCTLGDLTILLVSYWLVALLKRDRDWPLNTVLPNGFLFVLLGAAYTIYSEATNVRTGTWGYTALMPIVPIVNIGAMPLLQWVLIPPALLWLMRMLAPSPTRL